MDLLRAAHHAVITGDTDPGGVAAQNFLPNLVKVFEFYGAKLLQVSGNIFPSKEQREHIYKVELSPDGDGWTNLSLYGEDYITYILKSNWDGAEKRTVLAIKEKEVTWSLFNFFKIFIVHSIFILILVFVLIVSRFLRLKYSFRTKLLGALLLVSIIPIVALAIYNERLFVNAPTLQFLMSLVKGQSI